MSNAKALCLNMIVKNEMANLERCLSAVADHIDFWVIGDTGSTDGTQDFIRSFFAARNIPGELHSFSFHNFEQARNAALDFAYASPLAYDYLLFDDADMELVVEDRDFRTKLTAPSYTVLQRASISYWNTRLVRRDAGARYRGVTHEYVDVPGGGGEQLHGIWYKDHASGSNRVDKFQRDIRLLREALKKEPDNSRYWFYLAQSYRDAGQTEKAAEAYAKRAGMGGWDEEAWYARLQQARCLRKLGDEGGFLREALAAFNQRPQRAEPLYDIARYYRDKGSNDACALFAEAGLAMERPNDVLFIEDFVYTTGFKEEYSISANYSRDPARKERGFAACNWLALNRSISESSRNLAVSNIHFYVEPAAKMMRSFVAHQVGFRPPEGYRATNPSIVRRGDEILLVQRTVNYTIDPAFPDGDNRRYATPSGKPIHTRNFLLHLDASFAIRSSTEILPPDNMLEPAWPLVQGFEDLRPFVWRDGLWCIACVRELTPDGWCEQVLARIDDHEPTECRLTDWRALHPPGPRLHEKNWMPRVAGDSLQFVYLCDPTRFVDDQAQTVTETVPPIHAELFRGGSQLIAFDDGWLAIVHEARVRDKQRVYRHRFAWFDKADRFRAVSRPFHLKRQGVEFAAGLAWHPDGKRLIISYGVEDSEAWIATVDANDVRHILDDAEHLPTGAPHQPSRTEPTETPLVDKLSVPLVPEQVSTPDLASLIFIHSAPRTSSTWFWDKFRGLPSTLCYYEPFNEVAAWISPAEAAVVSGASWDSRHPPTDPYYREYLPVIGEAGGVKLFDPAMTIQWFIPLGGLRGELRPNENDYLTSLVQCARQAGKTPVCGDPRTLGRLWAIKNTLGGFHIFLHRNLWKQWLSFLYYRRRGDHTFVNVLLDTVNRKDDQFFSYLVHYYLNPAVKLDARDEGNTSRHMAKRRYVNLPSDDVTIAGLESLPEYNIFAIFVALHVYLYLHAELSADLTIDVTQIARDVGYRRKVEHAIELHTGMVISLSDVTDGQALANSDVDIKAINWGEIREHVGVAVTTLSEFGDSQRLAKIGAHFVDEAFAEATRSRAVETAAKPRVSGPPKSTQELFLELAPFLRSADSPAQRREQSRAFDTRIAPFLSRADGAMLPQIHCFYEVLSDKAEHKTLIAATTSMRATGHPVRVWSYTPQKLDFLKPHGIEVRAADDVVPRSLFDRIVARSEIRYFSDVFRYAVLYEHGGLWMDSDVVMLRPFPFRGEYFFNLQWRTGTKPEHYICGNVMYAEPFSQHLRALYETAIDRALDSRGWEFGIVGPKLLSDYIASDAGAALRDWVFSPMLFNPIDWTEIDRFDKPISELTEYLHDDRTFGIHLWTARNAARAQGNNAPLVSLLTDPLTSFPSFTKLADRFNTDKNRNTGNRHCYARVYDRLLYDRRFSLRRLMEIGLSRWNDTELPSVALWQRYFPFSHVVGLDPKDFSGLDTERFTSFVCNQSKRDDLRAVAAKLELGSFDVIIDDGSHASFDEQLTLCEFFPLLADGGWYFLEDLDWQPPGEDRSKITLTKNLLREIQEHGSARSIDPLGVSRLAEQMEEILFFDSHYELARAKLMGGLVAVRKRGGSGFVR